MQVYKFYEVLNDLYSYFLLADIRLLKNYQLSNELPNDLATEFTTATTGDKAVFEGIIIPLIEIENYPYTIIFNFGRTVELLEAKNDLQVFQTDYCLKVESGKINLFTWRALQNFDEDCINRLLSNSNRGKPNIKLENGWYQVAVYAGQTWQYTRNKAEPTLEPTIEFVLRKTIDKPSCKADIFTCYSINSTDY